VQAAGVLAKGCMFDMPDLCHMRFEILTVVAIKNTLFWDVIPTF
jgi:hypothetical protein